MSYVLQIPAADWFRREFVDLLADMLRDYNWQQVGSVTIYEATQAAETMYWSLTPMIGTIIAYATTDPPANVLPCDGATYAKVDYPALYAALALPFIVDIDHFTVPDLRGRALVGTGQGSGLTLREIGDSDGEEEHTLILGETPAHSHSDAGHIHSVHSHIDGLALTPGELPVSMPNPLPENTSSGNADIQDAGEDGAHNNMQPFLALNYGIVAW
jgi:microcystin-dependent protein